MFWPRPSVGSAIVRLDRLARPAGRRGRSPALVASSTPPSRNGARRCATRFVGSGSLAAAADAALAAAGIDPTAQARDARPRRLRARRPRRCPRDHARRPREAQRVPPRARPARRRLPRHRDADPAAGPARRRHRRARRGARGGRDRTSGRRAGRRRRRVARASAPHAPGPRRPAGAAPRARITVDKRIPVAAGLGGGSADAAATILALDELHGTDLDTEAQLGIAAAVGSDVPALLLGGPVYAAGRGELVTPVHAVTSHWAVAPAPFAVRTPDAYAWWDEHGTHRPRSRRADRRASRRATTRSSARRLFDDLQGPVVARHPEIAATIRSLHRRGRARRGHDRQRPDASSLSRGISATRISSPQPSRVRSSSRARHVPWGRPPGSSNGKTRAFGAWNGGSIPPPGTT